MKKRLLATCAGIALGAVLAGNALASGYSEWAQLKSSVVGGNYVRCELYDNTAVSDWYSIGDGTSLYKPINAYPGQYVHVRLMSARQETGVLMLQTINKNNTFLTGASDSPRLS